MSTEFSHSAGVGSPCRKVIGYLIQERLISRVFASSQVGEIRVNERIGNDVTPGRKMGELKKTVMILFHSQDQCFLTKMTHRLRERGKVAFGISQYEDLWMRVRQNPPDIIIFDDNNAQVNPIEIMQRLQAEGFKGRAIMLVGDSPEIFVPEVSKFGAIQIAGRPFSVNRVLCAIRIAQEQLQADRYTTSFA